MKKIILPLLVCITSSLHVYADNADSVLIDSVYSTDIKTIQFGEYGVALGNPVLNLDGTNQLQLSFDDLSGKDRTYYYSIIQCNINWTPSDLPSTEYLSSFNDNKITDVQFSFNTLQSYTHYQILFPNQDISITKSGNYIVKVYLDEDTAQVMFTRRFMVVDQKVGISGLVLQPADSKHQDYYQQVNFNVDYKSLPVNDPFSELVVVVQQNNRTDNEVVGLNPQFVQNGELQYQYAPELLFRGGKEFRYFDMQSLIYKGYHIAQLYDSLNQYFVVLADDEPSTFKQYVYTKDINGKYIINVMNSTHSAEEGDYAHVQFRIKMDFPLLGGKIYVVGELTDWKILPEFLMTYDYNTHYYIGNAYLKQGYYNYAYAYVEKGDKQLNLSEMDGDSYETENDYTIYVYYHPFGARYDRLVGIQTINSLNQNNTNNSGNGR